MNEEGWPVEGIGMVFWNKVNGWIEKEVQRGCSVAMKASRRVDKSN
jgi:hypothetical protein